MPPKRKRSDDGESGGEEEVDQVVSDVEDATNAGDSPVADTAAKSNDLPVPEKKRRGRPPGSKNKKPPKAAAASAADGNDASGEAGPSVPPPVKRPRGRPRKPRTEAELAAEREKANQPKRPRGRPPKKPRTDNPSGSTTAEASSSSDKKPRGRPKKSD